MSAVSSARATWGAAHASRLLAVVGLAAARASRSLALVALVALVALAAACGCGGGGGEADDVPTVDSSVVDGAVTDARVVDARVDDAQVTDASTCATMNLTPEQACAIALTGDVEACSIDAMTGTPSQRGWLAVRRPDGAAGYLCATQWSAIDGYSFFDDRIHLVDAAAACCGGPAGTILPWPAVDPVLGTPHGPTHAKPWETVSPSVGALRENPFAVIVSSPEAGATFAARRQQWLTWAGDGQPHPAPDGTGRYWFASDVAINWVVVPTATGQPLIVLAPEAASDAAFQTELGHPTLGPCAAPGGTPLAFIGGDLRGSVLANRSGRFGHESTITPAHLTAAAALLNCYGITVTSTHFIPN